MKDLEERCKQAGIELVKDVGEEKWRKRVLLRKKYKWFFKLKTNLELLFLNLKDKVKGI